MSNPVGETGSTQTTSPVTTTPATESTDPGSLVTGGFNTENSISQTEGPELGINQINVSIDPPTETTTTGISFDSLSFNYKLEGLLGVFFQFKAQFSADQIDLSDTQTLLMVFKGMVDDIKLLNNAQAIDTAEGQSRFRLIQSSDLREDIAQLETNINYYQLNIDTKSSEIQGKLQTLESKQAINTDGMTEAEKVQLQSEIDLLEVDIASLSGDISVLESQNQARRVQQGIREALIVIIKNDGLVDGVYLGDPKVNNIVYKNYGELDSGEEKLDALKLELKELDSLFSQKKLLTNLAKAILSDFNRELIRKSDRYSENIQPQGLAAELKVLLSPKAVNNLFSLFSAQNTSALAAVRSQASSTDQQLAAVSSQAPSTDQQLATVSSQVSPTEQQLADAAEGLALILFAGPSVTASEESPVDQPYLGDSISLEGANNPQAFTLLLLKEYMADIQEALDKKSGGIGVESVEINQLAQLLETEREVAAMVVEAYKDQQLSEAVISKSHPV